MGLFKNKRRTEQAHRFGAIEAAHAEHDRLWPTQDAFGFPVDYKPLSKEQVGHEVSAQLRDRSAELDLEPALQDITSIEELDSILTEAGGFYTEEDGQWHPPEWYVDLAAASAAAGRGYAEALDALPEEMQDWLLFRCRDAAPLRATIAEALQADPETEELEIPRVVREPVRHSARAIFRPRHV